MQTNHDKISNLISPKCSGIIWITKDQVDINHPDVYDLNYLLDGLLVKTLKEEFSKKESNHFFLSESFGRPFFIGHTIDSEKTRTIVQEHLSMILPLVAEGSEIFVMNQSNKHENLLKDLQKKYPQLTFKKV